MFAWSGGDERSPREKKESGVSPERLQAADKCYRQKKSQLRSFKNLAHPPAKESSRSFKKIGEADDIVIFS